MKSPKLKYLSMLANLLCCASILIGLTSCSLSKKPKLGELKVVAGLDFTPGGVAVSSEGRVFVSKHAVRPELDRPNLVELTSKETYLPFPDQNWNRPGQIASDRINTAHGVVVDSKNQVWITDHGNFISTPAQPKLLAYDIESKTLSFSYLLPNETAKIGSFIEHLAVDEKNGFVFLADLNLSQKPGLIVVDTKNSQSWRYEGLKEFEPENIDLYVSNRVVTSPDASGKPVPARVGLNAITLSSDNETLFFGSMNGLSWFSLPAKLLREHKKITELQTSVLTVGPKPICDGAITDSRGIHYFANLGANSVDYLDTDGILKRLITDYRLRWAESIGVGPGGWLYLAASQIDKAPLLNGGKEEGKPPYLILKVFSGSPQEK